MMMGIGLGVATLGAILRYAIEDDWDSMDVGVIGLILMIVGIVAFGTGVALEFMKRPRAAMARPSPADTTMQPAPPPSQSHPQPKPPAPPTP